MYHDEELAIANGNHLLREAVGITYLKPTKIEEALENLIHPTSLDYTLLERAIMIGIIMNSCKGTPDADGTITKGKYVLDRDNNVILYRYPINIITPRDISKASFGFPDNNCYTINQIIRPRVSESSIFCGFCSPNIESPVISDEVKELSIFFHLMNSGETDIRSVELMNKNNEPRYIEVVTGKKKLKLEQKDIDELVKKSYGINTIINGNPELVKKFEDLALLWETTFKHMKNARMKPIPDGTDLRYKIGEGVSIGVGRDFNDQKYPMNIDEILNFAKHKKKKNY